MSKNNYERFFESCLRNTICHPKKIQPHTNIVFQTLTKFKKIILHQSNRIFNLAVISNKFMIQEKSPNGNSFCH